MSKYSKFYSNYILSKKIQNAKGGSILLRDWTTLGETERLESGKSPIYNEGNFLFSSNNNFHTYKLFGTTEYEQFEYADVRDNIPLQSSTLLLNNSSNDIRDFAYYGSAVELVRTSIEHIIETFPGQITSTYGKLGNYVKYKNGIDIKSKYYNIPFVKCDNNGNIIEGYDTIFTSDYADEYIINNQFSINLNDDNVIESEVKNKYKYMFLTFKDYTINGNDIKSYDIYNFYNTTYKKEIIENNLDKSLLSASKFNCIWNQMRVCYIQIEDSKGNIYDVYGYLLNNELIFTCEEFITIAPKQEIIDDYFNKLEGFEKVLLNRNSVPLYKNLFITPQETDKGTIYSPQTYIFPSNGYCIDISTPAYERFIAKIYTLCQSLDDIWTDNLYQRMTHEAIRNYDWTYTREYENGDSEQYQVGGDKIQNLLHLFGLEFDKIKRYIDGIKFTNIVTYDNFNNLPLYHLTDSLENNGWEASLIYDEKNPIELGSYIEEKSLNWYGGLQSKHFNSNDCNVEFLKRLLLSARYINKSKGTTNSIEMILGLFGFGENDYTITEKYYETAPKKYDDYYQFVYQANNEKQLPKYDYDGYDGVPLNDININGEKYIVPFYNENKYYDDIDLYFQSKGGWMYSEKDKVHMETSPYMNVVADLDNLYLLRPITLSNFDVYYVMDLSKYILEENTNFISNYFCLVNKYAPNKKESWVNIDITQDYANSPFKDNNYNMSEVEYDNLLSKISRISNIVINNKGNNPHIGYGNYDNGNDFIDKLMNPFSYAINKNYLPQQRSGVTFWQYQKTYTSSLSMIPSTLQRFGITQQCAIEGQIVKEQEWDIEKNYEEGSIVYIQYQRFVCIKTYTNFSDCFEIVMQYDEKYPYNENDYYYKIQNGEYVVFQVINIDGQKGWKQVGIAQEWESTKKYKENEVIKYGNIYRCKKDYDPFSVCFKEIELWRPNKKYNQYQIVFYDENIFYNSAIEVNKKIFNELNNKLSTSTYKLNSKEIKLTFNLKGTDSNKLFESYFKSKIMPYLTQVIPSTTILSYEF